MKKCIKKLGFLLMSIIILNSTTAVTSFADEGEDPFVRLEQQGFKFITSNSTYSVDGFDVDKIESNLLFDQQAFVSVLDKCSSELRDAIYRGNIIAVFDDSNKAYQYEKNMNLPLGFEMTKNTKRNTHNSIGYIYQADEFGGIHITRVNVQKDTENEEKLYTFAETLSDYEIKSSVPMAFTQARSEMNTVFLGTIADYYVGEDEKGDVSVMYEVSTAQDIDKYDYYVVHAYIEATPGRAIYYSNYDADILTTSLSTSTTGATLYKTGPNTMTGATSYTVDVGFTGSKDEGVGGAVGFSWGGTIPDVNITKKVKSTKKCEWEVNINDKKEAAEGTISFEPGGTFRVSKSTKYLYVTGFTSFKVDAWNELPSVAAVGYTSFFCYTDTIE